MFGATFLYYVISAYEIVAEKVVYIPNPLKSDKTGTGI